MADSNEHYGLTDPQEAPKLRETLSTIANMAEYALLYPMSAGELKAKLKAIEKVIKEANL